MPNCCVPLCQTKNGKYKDVRVSLHEIPANWDLRDKWLKAISRKNWAPGASGIAHVCARHFLPEDYLTDTKHKLLRPGTVPSVFEGYPRYMQVQRAAQRVRPKSAIEKREEWIKTMPLGLLQKAATKSRKELLLLPPSPPKPGETRIERSIQVDVPRVRHLKEMTLWRTRCFRYKRQVKALKECLEIERSQREQSDRILQSFEKILDAQKDKDPYAIFIMDQIRNFGAKLPRWSESTVSECFNLRSLSFRAYSRARRLVRLPNINTLKRSTSKHIDDVLSAVSSGNFEHPLASETSAITTESEICPAPSAPDNSLSVTLQDHCYLATPREEQVRTEASDSVDIRATSPVIFDGVMDVDGARTCVPVGAEVVAEGQDEFPAFADALSYSVLTPVETELVKSYEDKNKGFSEVVEYFREGNVICLNGQKYTVIELAPTEVC